jgi:hypothetical protein
VAGAAVCNGVYIFYDLVLDFHMALVAFDFILINMFRMHEVCIFIFIESFLFPMTFITILPWDFAISKNGVAVALIAGKSIVEYQCVIITRGKWAYEDFFRMTVAAVIDLGIMLAFFEMTYEARAFRDGDVFTLDDLGMAACALELFPSFEVLKMDFVVERDIIELHFSFQESFVMASFFETTIVPNFRPGFGFDVKFRPIAADHDQAFDLFTQLGTDPSSGRIMTHVALDIFMGGGLPAFKIGCHEVTGGTKIRMGCEFYRT